MIIPDFLQILLCFSIMLLVIFIVRMVKGRQLMAIHKCFISAAVFLIIWIFGILGMGRTSPESIAQLYIFDSITTCCGALMVSCLLLFSVCYTNVYINGAPKWWPWLFVGSVITSIMVWTNPMHHLYYKNFSLARAEVVFGPYFYVHSVFTYACVALALILLIKQAYITRKKIQLRQTLLLIAGGAIPSIVNIAVLVLNGGENSIVVTPLSFMITIMCHGIVIFRLHLFDIRPMAMQQLIEWLADGYLVTNQYGVVVQYNKHFMDMLGDNHRIREGHSLKDSVRDEDVENKTALFNLISAVGSCRDSHSRITYEQSLSRRIETGTEIRYYMVEINPLVMENNLCGFMAIFKDVTQMKVDMQKIQENQVKMMENERLAFLGQMVGGIAHNLKTPIMSISGSISAVERLVEECSESLGDKDVVEEDYREIYSEINTWLNRMKEAETYMSDIIQAVKGQAQNMNTSNDNWFSMDDVIKRVTLLLRHELLNSSCMLLTEGNVGFPQVLLYGDINNLVQVVTNLVVNSIDAQLSYSKHDIIVGCNINGDKLLISVKDFGVGISEDTKRNLFRQMVTSKGTKGTGLGVFISNTVIKAKFDGNMFFEDNPEGGTIMNIVLPMKNVKIETERGANEVEKE